MVRNVVLVPINPKRSRIANKQNVYKKVPPKSCCAGKMYEFCNRTDLHGYKYTVMEELSVIERCVWIVTLVVSTVCAIFFVITAYRWYARNPIITVIESTQAAIWDIPFPAVTICDLNIVSRRAARKFSDQLKLPPNVTSEQVFEMLRLAPEVHSMFSISPENKQLLHELQEILDLNQVSLEILFKKLSPVSSCNSLLQRCMWKNTIYRCDAIFQQIFTYFSFCCSFNYFAIENSNVDIQLSDVEDMNVPRRVASCGYQTALTVLLHTDAADYYSSHSPSIGALVFIDNAYNVPDMDSPVRMVNPTTELLIALSPETTYSTPGVRAFTVHDRVCYFNNEVELEGFRHYSFQNCMIYRRMQVIKQHCDCVPFYYPNKGVVKNFHRTCNFYDIDCLNELLESNVKGSKDFLDPIIPEEKDGEITCLPECEHHDYPLEVALGKLAINAKVEGLPFFHDVNLENRSLINVFFNDLVSTRYRRDAYLNWQNLLASFGGLLSLMLGFTLISGFDLILFFTFGIAYANAASVPVHPTNAHLRSQQNRQILEDGGRKIYVTEHVNRKNLPVVNKNVKNASYSFEGRANLPAVLRF